MRAIAADAEVSVPTVEALFGTKVHLLKAAIDVAIAGDDEPVPVLDRAWTRAALGADTVDDLLLIVAGVIASAQSRAAGLVLAVFEGASTTAELAELSAQMTAQRAGTAEWIVDAVTRKAPLRDANTRPEAVDTVWVLMDPAVFDRLVRQRHWTAERYQRWLARSIRQLLTADTPRRSSP
jgi:AcrR family transcriptional regulator